MASKDEQNALHHLVQHVARAFYEPKYVIIMDLLIKHPVLKDDDLAGRIGLQAKELNKMMAILLNDRLVRVARQNELKDGAQRSIGKQYYYIDYQNFCNVVKWRVAEMRRVIESTLRQELVNKGYICPNCKSTFSPLEADRLMDYMRGTFICDQCPTSPGGPYEVILNEDEELLRGSNDRMERFYMQTLLIREGLKRSEEMILPAFNVENWIKKHFVENQRQQQSQNGGLKIAGTGDKRDDQKFEVQMEADKDEATRRQEREAEAEAKRQQNALPSWHLKSTVSGDLTSLGVKAKVHEAKSTAGSNAAILENLAGLGKPRSLSTSGTGVGTPGVKVEQTEVTIAEEKKDLTADFYEQYYASLEAASRNHSSSQTPMMDTVGSDFDDEEKKPNINHLNGIIAANPPLSTHLTPTLTSTPTRKRSRSPSDEGDRTSKSIRSANGTPGASRSSSVVGSGMNSVVDTPSPVGMVPETPAPGIVIDGENSGGEGDVVMDDPIVYVGGEPMPLSQVTDTLAESKMTLEEYTVWCEVVMSRSN